MRHAATRPISLRLSSIQGMLPAGGMVWYQGNWLVICWEANPVNCECFAVDNVPDLIIFVTSW